MRAFIAIELSSIFFNEIGKLQEQIKILPATFTFAKEPHLTLKFLGEITEKTGEEITQKLKKITFDPFTITCTQIGTFPSHNNIRVIWLGIEPKEAVIALQQKIDALFEQKENRFHPHITLARVKYVQNKEAFQEKIKRIVVTPQTMEVHTCALIKSTLTAKGPVYECIHRFGREEK